MWVAGEGPTIEWSHLPRKIVREKRLSFFLRLKILGHTSKYQTTRNYNRVSSAARRFIHKWADNYYWRPGSLRIQPIPRSLLYVVGLSVGMMSVSAVLCCCRRSCCLCMLPPRSSKTLFLLPESAPRILRTNNRTCTWSKKCPTLILGKAIYHAGRYV